MVQTWLVTGANRGIGLEYTRQLLAAGDRVIAAARDPLAASALQALAATHGDALRIEALDVGDAASVDAFAARLAGVAVDVLVNNAGLYGGNWDADGQRQTVDGMDYRLWEDILRVNVLGPFRVTAALRPQLALGRRRLVVMMSSELGSIAANTRGQSHAYRSSKAALNMVTRGLAIDLAGAGLSVVAMAPGWTQTDLGGAHATWTVTDSVSRQLGVLAALGPQDSGRFVNLLGETVAW